MTKQTGNLLQARLLGVSRAHFFYIGFLAIATVAYDATNLVTRDMVAKRWGVITLLLVITAIIWFLVREQSRDDHYYRLLTYALIIADIVFASYLVYVDRGMASRNVMLFAVPIAISALLNSRSAIFTAAVLSTAGYVFAATKYFHDYFNEGYKAELYSVLFLYGACFFVLAAVLWAIIRYQKLR